MAFLYTAQTESGEHPMQAWLHELVRHPGATLSIDNARDWAQRGFNMLCMRDHDDWLDLYWEHGMLRSRPGSDKAPPPILEIANDVAARVGETPDQSVIDSYQRAFGYPGLHIMDGSVIAANPGVNPSLTIAAPAERAMAFCPNKGEDDPRPPLGAGYERIAPVLPHEPIVPAGAPAAYRLDATEVSDPGERVRRGQSGQIAVRAGGRSMTPAMEESVIGDALGDPTLRLALWDPRTDGYVDVNGAPIDLPDGTRAQRHLDHASRPAARRADPRRVARHRGRCRRGPGRDDAHAARELTLGRGAARLARPACRDRRSRAPAARARLA